MEHKGSSMGEEYASVYLDIDSFHFTDPLFRQELWDYLAITYGNVNNIINKIGVSLDQLLVSARVILNSLLQDNTRLKKLHAPGRQNLVFMGIEDAKLPWVK
jgi:hypothetical protein